MMVDIQRLSFETANIWSYESGNDKILFYSLNFILLRRCNKIHGNEGELGSTQRGLFILTRFRDTAKRNPYDRRFVAKSCSRLSDNKIFLVSRFKITPFLATVGSYFYLICLAYDTSVAVVAYIHAVNTFCHLDLTFHFFRIIYRISIHF